MHDPPESLNPQNIVDRVALGRRLRSARVLAGYDRVTDLTTVLQRKYGVQLSDRSFYAIERGEQALQFDMWCALQAELDVPLSYFLRAVRADVADTIMAKFRRRSTDET